MLVSDNINREQYLLISPYVIWMTLMTFLPSTAGGYAMRTVATALTLAIAGWMWNDLADRLKKTNWLGAMGLGVVAGLVVFALWVWPERFDIYRRLFVLGDRSVADGSPFDPAVCGWPLTCVRLIGSAFIISIAEELFFRKWMIGFAGFWWMVVLFAIEHDRWLVGAIAGAIYGWIYLRRGLVPAIIAHATTNLVLGLWVIWKGCWAFW